MNFIIIGVTKLAIIGMDFQRNFEWAEAKVVGGDESYKERVKSVQEMTHALYPTTRAFV